MSVLNLISWNVNGARAVLKKGFLDFLAAEEPHVLGIQETKLQEEQIPGELRSPLNYQAHWNHAERKGYSGTALFSRIPVTGVSFLEGNGLLGLEGRVIQADFNDFIYFNVYFPNGQMHDERLEYKLRFYDEFLAHCESLRGSGRSLILTGDFNTAHREIDLKNPRANENRSGFLPVERAWMDRLMEIGYVDTFRMLYPHRVAYSWWTYRFQARQKNVGWRIDYFLISPDLVDRVEDALILTDVAGSDHCPVGLKVKI